MTQLETRYFLPLDLGKFECMWRFYASSFENLFVPKAPLFSCNLQRKIKHKIDNNLVEIGQAWGQWWGETLPLCGSMGDSRQFIQSLMQIALHLSLMTQTSVIG